VEQVFLILNIQALPGGFPSFVCRFRDNSQPVHQLDLTIPGAPAEVSFLATEETRGDGKSGSNRGFAFPPSPRDWD